MLGPAWRCGGERGGGEFIEASAPQAEFIEGLVDGECVGAKAAQDLANKRSGVAQVELLVVFIPAT